MTTLKTVPAISFAIQSMPDGGYVLEKMIVTMGEEGEGGAKGIRDISITPVAARTELYEIQELMAKQMAEAFQVSPYRPPAPQPQLNYRQGQPQPFLGGHDYPAGAEPLPDRPAVLDNWSDKNGPPPSSTFSKLKDRIANGTRDHVAAVAAFVTLAAISLAEYQIA